MTEIPADLEKLGNLASTLSLNPKMSVEKSNKIHIGSKIYKDAHVLSSTKDSRAFHAGDL